MTYANRVLHAAISGEMPEDASDRFLADVGRVLRHIARENRTGIYRELHIPTPRGED